MYAQAELGLTALAADPFETNASVHTLDNGLTVILEEDHRIDAVALNLMYGVGSRDELQGEQGFAHLFEHLMFEGSANGLPAGFGRASGGGSLRCVL